MTVTHGKPKRIAVVGGSAAGFFTAKLLARAGQQVGIFERDDRLDPTPRTLIVTTHLRELLGASAGSAVVNEIRRFEMFADGRVADVRLARPDLIIERSKVIRGLAEQSVAAGAEVHWNRNFLGVESAEKGLRVAFERRADGGHEQIEADAVVGADGAFSRVAQAAGWPPQPTVPLVQAIVRWPRNVPPDTVRVWFVPEETPYFYWLIPESPSQGVLGLIGEDGRETRRCLDRFLHRQQLTPLKFQGARIPLYERWIPVRRKVGHGDVYLVGDAAGQVKVTTVGGIVTGLRGAVGVAEALLNGGSSRELRALRRELDLHLLIRRGLHRFTQSDYCRLFDLLSASALKPLRFHHRDEAGKILWRLCLRQPRLLLLGIRALLTGGSWRAPLSLAALPGAREIPES
jgi:flavin-dependent dehydrogenase